MHRRPYQSMCSAAFAVITALHLPASALAAPGDKWGNEFRVNLHIPNEQTDPAVARDADGDFIVVWTSIAQVQDGSGPGVFGRRFSAAGSPLGGEFLVNTTVNHAQDAPAIAMDADGDFIIAWQSKDQNDENYNVYVRRYDAAGVAQSDELQVNAATINVPPNPAIAADAGGNFIVAWTGIGQDSYGIFARRYNAAGAAQNDEFLINTYTTNKQKNPAIAMDADGDFVVAWQSKEQDGESYGVYARRYDDAGGAQGDEFKVNTATVNFQQNPAIAMDAGGDFIVAWTGNGQDGSGTGIFAQRYDAAGLMQDVEFQVNALTTNDQTGPSISSDAAGNFVIAWTSAGQDSLEIFARLFTVDGIPLQAEEFHVNTFTTNAQILPAVAADADGDFIITWTSFTQDAAMGSGIFAQHYVGLQPVDIALTLNDSPDPAQVAQSLSYALAITNNHVPIVATGFPVIDGAIGAATAVTLSNTLPPGTSFISAAGDNWTCSPVSGRVDCSFADVLLPGALSDLAITVNAPAAAGFITGAATVTAQQFDTDPTNNEAQVSTTVNPTPTPTPTPPPPAAPSSGGGGGGCTLRSASADPDPLWMLWLLWPGIYALRRYRMKG